MIQENLISFLVISIACWRLSSLFAKENGPFYIFLRLRHLAGVRYEMTIYSENQEITTILTLENTIREALSENLDAYNKKNTKITAELASCVWCNSLWISAFLVFFAAQNTYLNVYTMFVLWFFVSAVSIYVDEKVMNNEK